MVEGLSHTGRPIAAVDLDGTLVAGNTLHIYIRTALAHVGMAKRLRILCWLAARRLRLASHQRMKFAILDLIEPTDALLDDFKARVSRHFNPAVTRLLDRLRSEGYRVILATAAPDVYIPRIWNGDFVATPTRDNPERHECRGTAKLAAVHAAMQPGDYLAAVITDHLDDLPLLAACTPPQITSPSTASASAQVPSHCTPSASAQNVPTPGTNYLVNPDTRTLTALRAASLPFTLL